MKLCSVLCSVSVLLLLVPFVVVVLLFALSCWLLFEVQNQTNLSCSVVALFFFCFAADKPPKLQERDFSGTAYVPVYVMLPGQLGVINMDCQLVDQDNLLNQAKILKPVNVDGVVVDF
ncbi:Beta-amylase 7 [Camellia lanceoleosa]|uniref:Beta-amylase 7 n=1 Tax=Camellia lanceoleosa TaxID=1840588 RepID=A0ACC0G1X9_9ERIC|nr:Beta-amylase 7 [Camellia lanceoleosa]